MALLMLCLLVGLPAQATRLALVIGNDGYRQIEPLKNARNDARLMATTLKEAGFDVERVHENLDRDAMYDALHNFASRIKKGDEVVFFYAGHGAQFGATPVLLPTDIKKDNEKKMEVNSVALSYVQAQFKEAGFSLLVIDACRDNPFDSADASGTRGLERAGLSMITVATGNAIIMSASRGQKALDYIPDNPRSANSLFTHELVQAIKTPGQDVHTALREVRERVEDKAKLAGNPQLPDMEDKTRGRFFFFSDSPRTVAAVVSATSIALTSEQEVEQKLWNAIEASSDVQDFQDYLKRYPNGRFAPLAQRQVRVLTARQQPVQQVQAQVVASAPAPGTAPTQTNAAAPASGSLGKRVALLIGNDGSLDMPLETPFRDIQLIESTLRPLGFTVERLKNASRSQIVGAIRGFRKQAQSAEIALIYFAGQGYRISGTDYIHPYDVSGRGGNVSMLAREGFAVKNMVQAIDNQADLGIIIVDAGREELAGLRGFGVESDFDGIPIGSGMAVAFSTRPGTSPSDGFVGSNRAENSPFAISLATHLKNADLNLERVFEQTKLDVMALTKDAQVPRFEISGGKEIYLFKRLVSNHTR